MVYRVLFGRIRFGYIGSMVSRPYVYIPCSILGTGALFGGIFLQSIVAEFNITFGLGGILKIIPIMCVLGGVAMLRLFLIYGLLRNYAGEGHVKDSVAEFITNIMAKM